MAGRTRVYLEVGTKRAFASAADWPGWCRAGKDEPGALANLAAYAPRYAPIARLAGLELPKDATTFEVVERLKGDATTDFGAPSIPASAEARHLTKAETDRMVALAEACWNYLDRVRSRAPKELRRGPRGGGRDRDKMYAHVLDAELAYASRIGLKLKKPDRKAMLERFADPNRNEKWPIPYAVRRTAWHALDHAWEMEDRIT